MERMEGIVASITDLGDRYEFELGHYHSPQHQRFQASKDYFRSIRRMFAKPLPSVGDTMCVLVDDRNWLQEWEY